MFCDLVGSTALSGQLDPEELSDVTREYHSVCAEVIERHAGRIAQFLGDGLLVYFGYPLSHEDDAQRAVRAGLDIVAAIASEQERLGKPLQVRIAVHTGLAVVGQLGGDTNPDPMAISGETPNIAARLQSIAEPGHVVISAATYRLIQGFFVCRSLGTPALKGVVAPIEAFEVVEPTVIHTRFERAVASGLTPFVSREKEVGQLLDLWQAARNGSGQVVMINGEAGIGKSRLVQVLAERTADEPLWELGGRCSPYYQNSALYPTIEFLQRMLRFNRNDDAETKLAKLEKTLAQFGFSLSEMVPLFAALLSLPAHDSYLAPPMTPQRQKHKTFEAIVEWLMRTAEQKPTRLTVEDLHWADPSTLELIELLIEQVSAARLLLILVFRPEFVPAWPSRPYITNLSLGRLAPTATELMIQSLAGGKQLPAEVVNEIVAKTDGVPLFVEELTQMVLESGLVQEQGGRYVLTSALPSLAIPSTLYDSLMARLDQLGTAKDVAQLAATIGKEFSYELLRTVSPLEETRLTGALNRLVDAELLDQNLEQNRLRYGFRHALIRDAAYDSLLRSQRRHYHRRVAEVLQEHFADTVQTRPELIANHFTEAGLIEEAIPYWHRAAQRALERSANREAIDHLTRGLELVSLLPETPERVQQELMLRIGLGTALMVSRGFACPEAENNFARAWRLCQQIDESPIVLNVFWALWVSQAAAAKHQKAREAGEECLRLAQAAHDPALLLQSHHALGVSLLILGDFVRGFELLEKGVSLYDPSQHSALAYASGQDSGVACLAHGAWALWFLGYPGQARKWTRDALALAGKVTHPASKAAASNVASWVYQLLRDQEAAQEQADAAIALSTEHELEFWRAMGLNSQGWALTGQGRLDEGIKRLRTGLTALHATGAGILMPYYLSTLAQAYANTDRIDEAVSILAESQAALEKTGERWWQAEVYRIHGELLLRHSGAAPADKRAEEYFRRALQTAREQCAKSLELRAIMSLSRLLQRRGERSEARQMLTGIYNWFTEGFDTPDLQEARALIEQM
jgi:class 3 adenylate cyclase/predicted ATPase